MQIQYIIPSMPLPDAEPFETVSAYRYHTEYKDRLSMADLTVGCSYIARFIRDRKHAETYAGDYLVSLHAKDTKKVSRLPSWIVPRLAVVTLIDCDIDGDELYIGKPMDNFIDEDGSLYEPTQLLINVSKWPFGYLLSDEEYTDDSIFHTDVPVTSDI